MIPHNTRSLARLFSTKVGLLALAFGGFVCTGNAQETPPQEVELIAPPAQKAQDTSPTAAEANWEAIPPVDPTPLSLQECIELGMQHQPAIQAAQASLQSAYSAKAGLDGLRFGAIISHDLPIRKKQACWGIQIAEAGLLQAEWETRYAITRNYYSIIYARDQEAVLSGLVAKLDRAAKKAQTMIDAGDPKIPVTVIDRDTLIVQRDFYKSKLSEATRGIDRAIAALREAIGLPRGEHLVIGVTKLPAPVTGLKKDELVDMALARRGEMVQATGANQVTILEIYAQGKIRGPLGRTFASGSDIHAKQIPQGMSNGNYIPGAIGLDYPTNFAGKKNDRQQRARDLNQRAGSVVDKTTNLITLEVEAAFFKYQEAADRLESLRNTAALAQKLAENAQGRFDNGKASGEDLIRAQTTVDQVRANYNEALYQQVLGLAALERATAGGFRIPTAE